MSAPPHPSIACPARPVCATAFPRQHRARSHLVCVLLVVEYMGLLRQISRASTATGESHATESRTLDSLSESSRTIDGVWADDVEPGDLLIVHTQNSVY